MVEKGSLDNKLYRYISSEHGLKELKAAIASIDLEKYPSIKKKAILSTSFFLDNISRGVMLQKELEEERQKGEAIERLNERLITDLQNSESRNKDLERRLLEAEQRISEMEKKTINDELQIQRLNDELADKDRTILELNKKLEVAKVFEERLRIVNDNLERQKKNLDLALTTLGVSDGGRRTEIIRSIAEDDQQAIVKAFRDAGLDYTMFQKEIESIRQKSQSIEDNRSALERKLNEALLKLENEKKASIDKIKKLEELVKSLNNDKLILQNRFDELKNEYDASRKLSLFSQELALEKDRIARENLDRLQLELDRKQKELEAANNDLLKEKQKVEEINLRLSILKEELVEKDLRIKNLESESGKGANASLENNIHVCYSFTDGNGNQKYPFPLTKNDKTLDPVMIRVREKASMKKDDPINPELLNQVYRKVTADGAEVGLFGVLSSTAEGKQVITLAELGNASKGFKFELTLEDGNSWILTSTYDKEPGYEIHDYSSGVLINLEDYGGAITVKKKQLEVYRDIKLADREMAKSGDNVEVASVLGG